MSLDTSNKSNSSSEFDASTMGYDSTGAGKSYQSTEPNSNEPIEATVLTTAGWAGVILSLIAWYLIADVGSSRGYGGSSEQHVFAAIVGVSGIIGALILAGFGRIISLLWDINRKTVDPHKTETRVNDIPDQVVL